MHTEIAILLAGVLSLVVEGISPPVRFGNRLPRPEAVLDEETLKEYRRVPPALRTNSGPPGSYAATLDEDLNLERWRSGSPGSVVGEQADGQGGKYPVGPPGSEAASMAKKMHNGPPGTYQRRMAAAAPSEKSKASEYVPYNRFRGPPGW